MKRVDFGTVVALVAFTPLAATAMPTESVLYRFGGGADGLGPAAALTLDASGALYGTTQNGGGSIYGTVFKLTPPAAGQTTWSKTVLYSFQGGTDGANPTASLILDTTSALYGTTSGGGGCPTEFLGCGTVFKLTPPVAGHTAWGETVLHSFQGGTDGYGPIAGLAADASGALYGTTYAGGGGCPGVTSDGCGPVFKLTPPAARHGAWTEVVLYRFKAGTDGNAPVAGLIADVRGAFFGTTAGGGAACPTLSSYGCGTVFKLAPPASGQTNWSERVLYRFKGGTDGRAPGAGLVADATGALYGTTENGGGGCPVGYGCGAVFRLTPPAAGGHAWSETVLYGFKAETDGEGPFAGVILGTGGALYGTTSTGGAACPRVTSAGCGTVFALMPPAAGQASWTETVLHRFTGMGDGETPLAGLIVDPTGALYGSTFSGGNPGCGQKSGCGTVFQVVP